MEEQIATSQPSMYMPEAVIKTAATATDILALKDARVAQLQELREDHMDAVEEIDLELKQLGAIGAKSAAMKPARMSSHFATVQDSATPLATNGKRGRGRPAGAKNKPKAKAK